MVILMSVAAMALQSHAQAAVSSSDSQTGPAYVAKASVPDLPEAPEPQSGSQTGSQTNNPPSDQFEKPLVAAAPKVVPATTNLPMAPMYSRVIPAGMATPQIHGRDKIVLAARDLYAPGSFVNFITSAGWDQLTNGQPNYGTNSGAFAQRVGAAAVRDTTQAFLSNGPFAVMLHQDPRYFELGPQYSIPRRTWYALTRALVTRDSTDGHAVFNSSLILGQAAGTALNNLYYPKSNRNFQDNLESFGGSIGGAALSFVLDEYTAELWKAMHLRRQKD